MKKRQEGRKKKEDRKKRIKDKIKAPAAEEVQVPAVAAVAHVPEAEVAAAHVPEAVAALAPEAEVAAAHVPAAKAVILRKIIIHQVVGNKTPVVGGIKIQTALIHAMPGLR